jgi:nitroreductase
MSRRGAASGALRAPGGAAPHRVLRHDCAAGEPGIAGAGDATPPDDPPGDLPQEVVLELVAAATMAPSKHNSQPWRFRFDPASQTIGLYADPERTLRVSDPAGRGLHIACGAALFNLRLAAAVAGRHPVVRLTPDAGQPLLIAAVRLAGPCQPQEQEVELHATIAGVCAELAEAAQIEGAVLHFPDRQEASRLLGLAQDAERDLLADPAYRAELAQWVGGARDLEGIPDEVAGPRDPERATPVRDFTPARPRPPGYAWFEEEPQLAVLSTLCDGRADWVRAGQAMQRAWLTATLRGVAVAPITLPLETGDAWQVRDPRSGIEYPQMILRLGYGLPVPHAPRRPVSDFLDIPRPDD